MNEIKGNRLFEGKHISKLASIINRFSQIYFDRTLKGHNIGSGQQFFLLLVNEYPGINQYELAMKSGFDKGTTAKAVKKLEELGYLIREIDDDDKRANKLFTTTYSKEVIQITLEAIEDWKCIITKGLSEEEEKEALNYMRTIAENAVNYIWKDSICKK